MQMTHLIRWDSLCVATCVSVIAAGISAKIVHRLQEEHAGSVAIASFYLIVHMLAYFIFNISSALDG